MKQLVVLCALFLGTVRTTTAATTAARAASVLLLGDLSEANVRDAIRLAKLSGSHVGLAQTSWARCADGYQIHPGHFPGGLPSLARAVSAVRAAGVQVTFHVAEPYAAQQPDPALRKANAGVLSQPMNRVVRRVFTLPPAQATHEGPGVLQIGDEFVTFRRAVRDGAAGFIGCGRAAFGTSPRRHAQGTPVHRVLDTPRLRAVPGKARALKIAQRLIHVLTSCQVDSVYIEGRRELGPGLSEFGAQIAAGLMGPANVKRFMVSGPTGSLTPPPAIRVMRLRAGGSVAARFGSALSGRQGQGRAVEWLWSPMLPTCIEAEQVCVRALAWNAPLVVRADVRSLMDSDGAERLLRLLRAVGEARRSGDIDPQATAAVRSSPTDHLLVKRAGRWSLCPVQKRLALAGKAGCDAFLLAGDGGPRVACVPHGASVKIVLPSAVGRLSVHDRYGKPIPTAAAGDLCVVPANDFRLLAPAHGVAEDVFLDSIARARVATVRALWVQAEDCESIVGKMAKGSALGLPDKAALGDFILATAGSSPAKQENWYCRYQLEFPRAGLWHLWGRVWYEDTNSNSFAFAQGAPADRRARFGNDMIFKQWHWDRGPTLHYGKGSNTFRVYEREGSADPAKSPRLDMICFTDDPTYRPTDDDARLGLALQQARGTPR